MPDKKYVKISRIDVHIERTFALTPNFNNALPELRKQACLSGADAVVEIEEQSSQLIENRMYHVVAVGIKYIDGK